MSGSRGRKRGDVHLTEDVGELDADSGAAAAAARIATAAAPPRKKKAQKSAEPKLLLGPAHSDIVTQYVSTLRELEKVGMSSVVPVSDHCYAMPGCNMHNNLVQVLTASQVHIYVAPIRFKDGNQCILTCDACCESQRIIMQSVDGSSEYVHEWTNESAAFAESKECVHVKAFKMWDADNDHVPDDESFVQSAFGASPMQFGTDVVFVNAEPFVASLAMNTGIYSRVFVKLETIAGHKDEDNLPKKYVKCLRCPPSRNYSCEHVQRFFEWASDDANMSEHLNGTCIRTSNAQPQRRIETVCATSISSQMVKIDSITEHMLRRVRGGSWLPLLDKCVPPVDGTCSCGCAWDPRDPVAQNWVSPSKNRKGQSILYGTWACRDVTVYYRPCTHPKTEKCKRLYDGKEDGIFNLSGDSLFLYETLFAYIDAMTHSKMTVFAQHGQILEAYARSGDNFCSCGVYHRAIQLFMALIDVDYDVGFTCPCCSDLHPKDMTIIADGKARGHKRSLVSSIHPDVPYSLSDPVVRCDRPVEYAYIRNSSTRSLIYDYAYWKNDKELPQRFKDDTPPGLVKMLNYITENNTFMLNGKRVCPPVYRDLIACISTPHPVTTIIPAEMVYGIGTGPSVFDDLISGRKISADTISKVVALWPVLGAVMAPSGKASWTTVPDEFRLFLEELQVCAKKPGELRHGDVPPVSQPGALPDDPLAFFSGKMKKRWRRIRNYSVDAKVNAAQAQESEYGPCTKHLKKGHKFTPGLFSVVCPHGVILGFQALRRFEGPSTLFTLLYERFEFAPGTVVYDNACNAGRYCLSREPKFFSLTKWLIDRLHFKNHIGCHSCFNIDMYPSDTKILNGKMTLGQLNTQAVEQVNSKLSYMGGVSFMKESSYVQYVKLFMYLLNRQKIAKVNA